MTAKETIRDLRGTANPVAASVRDNAQRGAGFALQANAHTSPLAIAYDNILAPAMTNISINVREFVASRLRVFDTEVS